MKEIDVRLEVLDRLAKLKDELEDMTAIVKQDLFDKEKDDSAIQLINLRIKELEQQMVRIIS